MTPQYTLRNPTFLYVIREDGDKNSKIGICSSQLWERLRKLQQGNPRNLRMEHLWLGERLDVEFVEKRIKEDHCNYKSEWSSYNADELKSKVDQLVKENDLVYLSMRHILPYTAKTANKCSFRNHVLSLVYNAGRLFPNMNVYVADDGYVYQKDPWKQLWPVEEKQLEPR